MKIKEIYNKYKKKALITALGLATIVGTYSGNEGGFPPFYNIKAEKSYGINIGIFNKFLPESEFNGICLGIYNTNYGGKINGLKLGLTNFVDGEEHGKLNGLEIALVNLPEQGHHNYQKVNGGQISIANVAESGNNFQVGLFNFVNTKGNNLQLGFYNQISRTGEKEKRGFLLNYQFSKK